MLPLYYGAPSCLSMVVGTITQYIKIGLSKDNHYREVFVNIDIVFTSCQAFRQTQMKRPGKSKIHKGVRAERKPPAISGILSEKGEQLSGAAAHIRHLIDNISLANTSMRVSVGRVVKHTRQAHKCR